jgi:uncharacterized protein YwqG
MSKEAIIQLLEQAGLEQYKQAIASWIYSTAQLILEPVPDVSIPVGSSKVGGNPDLPEEVEWPRWKNDEMTFIAQINLAECPSELSLPQSGLLSFFYAVQSMFKDEYFFGDPDTCCVIYTGTDRLDHISRRNTPGRLKEEARMRSNRVSFIPELSVPASESTFLESLGLGWNGNRKDFNKYWEVFLSEFGKQWEREGYINRLMGHPDQIQGDMQVRCEMTYGGHTWDLMEKPEVRKQIVNSAVKWRMLLQIDSEEDKTGIMWGDVGRIYYWIHENDLKALRFDRVICEMQCT